MVKGDTSLTLEYCAFLERNAGNPYAPCLAYVVESLLLNAPENTSCLLLYGGLVRDGKPFLGWSDIDLVAVFRDTRLLDLRFISELIADTQQRYEIRLDLTQLDLADLAGPHIGRCYNSEVMNALALRPGVSQVLYGRPPSLRFDANQETQAAWFYLDDTSFRLRRFIVETALQTTDPHTFRQSIARVTRWVFSMIRASLRLFGIYCHPYEQSLAAVSKVLPHVGLDTPRRLLTYRNAPYECFVDMDVFQQSMEFVTNYKQEICRHFGVGV